MPDRHRPQTRRAAICAGLATAAAVTAGRRVDAAQATPSQGPAGDLHDWDYYVGEWSVVNRRLKTRWTTHPEWDEFPGSVRYVDYLGGVTNVSETIFPTKRISGLTVRTFDLQRRLWSIYWISSRDGVMGPPMLGGFQGERGEFRGADVDGGQPILVRVLRTKQPPDHERWEQAFSRDDGASWETNWTADFTRLRR